MTMMRPSCRLEVHHDGPVSTVYVVGELDVASVQDLRDCFISLAGQGQDRVIVDLNDLDFIDSTGLGALIGGLKRFQSRGGELVLRDPRPSVTKVLGITGLDRIFTVV